MTRKPKTSPPRFVQRDNPELVARVRIARQRVEGGERPLYQRVWEAHAMQQARVEKGESW